MSACPECYCPLDGPSCSNPNCCGYRQHPGAVARDEAIENVERGAHPDWLAAAYAAARDLAKSRETFTTDDVWAALDGCSLTTPEPRAMGAVMRKLSTEGLVVNTHTTRLSSRPECHRRPVTVWARTGA